MNISDATGRGEIILFQDTSGNISVNVRLERETVWLNLNQMAELFERDNSVISRHLLKVFKEGELERHSVVAKYATTASDGKTYQVEYFNLDAILSVGYRVNSRRGTLFRIWATSVLREHIIRGYTVNQVRLKELNQAVKLIADTAKRRDISSDEALALLGVVGEYNQAMGLLDDYDHQRVTKSHPQGKLVRTLEYEEAQRIVAQLRSRFGASNVFGIEKDKGMASALGAIMQTAGGEDVYPSLEEKAAHLLYFLVKNHAFVDGNKRIAAALFLWFLEINGALRTPDGEPRISNASLVAITLMIAASRPVEKEVLVRIVTHLMCENCDR
ncbi:putative DNA-binding protein [Dehalogenimonas sp. WBC-2]|nr:putative DNA-binding protein [Dehalogenimonas sp. WBC-2]